MIELINNLPLPSAIFDDAGFIISYNRSWEKVYGNKSDYSLFHEPLLIENSYKPLLKRVFKGEINLRTKPIFCTGKHEQIPAGLTGKYIVYNVFPLEHNSQKHICVIVEEFADPLDTENHIIKEQETNETSFAIFKMIESERRRISHELHDVVIQKLLVAKLEIELLQKNSENFSQRLDDIKNNILDISKDIRLLIQNLHPVILENEGLIKAIELLAAKYNYESDILVKLDVFGDYIITSKSIELNLYRIVHEALLNAKKHSCAKNILVQLHFNEDIIIGAVIDDGKGLNSEDLCNSKGYGIISMKERAKALKGELSIETGLNEGTKVIFHIPLKIENNEQN